MHVQGDLKLIDKQHLKVNLEYTEILSNASSNDQLIKFYFRQVEKDVSNFRTVYKSILSNVLFNCNSLQIVCHRTAIIHILSYLKGITDNLNLSDKENDANKDVEPKSVDMTSRAVVVDDRDIVDSDTCQFNIIANMNNFMWKMHDAHLDFGNMTIKQLGLTYSLKGIKTKVKVQLEEIRINYDDNSAGNQDGTKVKDLYRQIISCTADNQHKKFFDFSLILYDTSNVKSPDDKWKFKDSMHLSVGKIKVICLVKFVNQLADFFEPIINPLPTLTEQVKEQAIEAVNLMKNKYAESADDGASSKQIDLFIVLVSPEVIVPKNSRSQSAFLVNLGNLRITNKFVESFDDKSAFVSLIDNIEMKLEDVQVKRIIFEIDKEHAVRERVIEPINFSADLKRLVRKAHGNMNIADIEISLKISNLESSLSLKTARLLFAILDENLNEGIDTDKQQDAGNVDQNQRNAEITDVVFDYDTVSLGKIGDNTGT